MLHAIIAYYGNAHSVELFLIHAHAKILRYERGTRMRERSITGITHDHHMCLEQLERPFFVLKDNATRLHTGKE